jgi:chemotaxis signal transduction protein
MLSAASHLRSQDSTMTTEPYLIFALHGSPYAVSALSVCEIIPLPELTPLGGIASLRGRRDQSARQSCAHHRPQLTHGTGAATLSGCRTASSFWKIAELWSGIIVNEVCRVRNIADMKWSRRPLCRLPRDEERVTRFVSGVAKVDGDLIMLLHLENLLHLPRDMALPESEEGRVNSAPSAELAFYSEATPQKEQYFMHVRKDCCSLSLTEILPVQYHWPLLG